jgi:hypothetical protein
MSDSFRSAAFFGTSRFGFYSPVSTPCRRNFRAETAYVHSWLYAEDVPFFILFYAENSEKQCNVTNKETNYVHITITAKIRISFIPILNKIALN